MFRVVFFIFIVIVLYSQTAKHIVDSLNNAVSKYKDDVKKAQAYSEVAFKLRTLNPDTAFILANISLSFLKNKTKENNIILNTLAKDYVVIGIYYDIKGKDSLAIANLKKSIKLAEKTNNNLLLGYAYNGIGTVYINTGKYDKAIYYLKIAEKFFKKANEIKMIAAVNVNIGNVYYFRGVYDSTLYYYNVAINFLKKINDLEITLSLYNNLGIINLDKGDFNSSIKYYNEALKIAKELNHYDAITDIYINLANVYKFQGDYKKALDYYIKGMELAEKYELKRKLSYILLNIGSMHLHLNDFEQAKEYIKKSINIAEEIKDREAEIHGYRHLGTIYVENNKHDSAMVFYKKALYLSEKIGATLRASEMLANIGGVFLQQKKMDSAEFYFNKAIEYAKKVNNDYAMVFPLLKLAKIYMLKNKIDSALSIVKKLYYSTQDYGIVTKQDITQLLSELYAKKKNYKKAYKFLTEYIELHDSINKEENKMELIRKEIQYEYDKQKAIQSALYKEKIEKRNLLIYSTGILLIVVLVFTTLLYSRFKIIKKQKQVIENKQHELEVMNKQLKETNKIIESQAEELKVLLSKVEDRNRAIMSSINYAKRIQTTLLKHSLMTLNKMEFDYFLFYKPRDVVSGDFFWAKKKNNITYIAVADCTGHGVPGALLSILGMEILNKIMQSNNNLSTAEIITILRNEIIERMSINQEEQIKDGMDLAIISIDKNRNIQYSSANNPIYVITKNKNTLEELKDISKRVLRENDYHLIELVKQKQPIGVFHKIKPFICYNFTCNPGDIVVLFSDGYADQFGGNNNIKLGTKRFKKVIINACKDFQNASQYLEEFFNKWKGKNFQIDDITVLGIKL